MPSHAVSERLAGDVGTWVTDGLVSAGQAATLRERWSQGGFGAAQVVKYFGYSGGLIAMAGLLGLVAAVSGSEVLASVECLGLGAALFYWGIRLSREPLGRYELSSRIVLALGYFSASLGVGVFAHALEVSPRAAAFLTGLVCVPAAFAAAYRLRSTFVLVLGLLALFHWAGSWTGMIDRSTYSVSLEDPRAMAAMSAVVAAFGAVHDRVVSGARPAFAHAFGAVSLAYLNLSLLVLTVGGAAKDTLPWIGVWAGAGVAQVVAGARLHSALFTAFGVTSLAVNLFTRYFEHFWDSLDAGLFFLFGGAALFAAGFGFEALARRRPAR